MKALKNYVIIEKNKKSQTSSGLVLPTTAQKKQQGIVVSLGDEVKDKKLLNKEVVYFDAKTLYQDNDIVILAEEDILAEV